MKRFLLYIGAVLFLSLVGLSIYVFMIRQDVFEETPPQDVVIPDSNASIFDSNTPFALVSSKETVEVGSVENGDVIAVFGNGSAGVFDSQGTLKQEFSSGLYPIVKAAISPKGDRVSMFVLDTETHEPRWYEWDFLEGVPSALSEEIDDIFYRPDGAQTQLITSDTSSETRIVTIVNGRAQTILTSRIPDVRAQWTDSSNLLLTTLPSGDAGGIAYLFNTRTRGTQRFLGGKFGLSAIGAGTSLLFSETQNQGGNRLKTSIYSNGSVRGLPLITLPERCVAGGTGSFICSSLMSQEGARLMPDDYLKGKVINNTSILFLVDAASGSVNSFASVPFDATRPTATINGDYIFSIDKNSGSLWRIRVN